MDRGLDCTHRATRWAGTAERPMLAQAQSMSRYCMHVLAAKRVRSIEETRDQQSARLPITQMSDSCEAQKVAKDDSKNAA